MSNPDLMNFEIPLERRCIPRTLSELETEHAARRPNGDYLTAAQRNLLVMFDLAATVLDLRDGNGVGTVMARVHRRTTDSYPVSVMLRTSDDVDLWLTELRAKEIIP